MAINKCNFSHFPGRLFYPYTDPFICVYARGNLQVEVPDIYYITQQDVFHLQCFQICWSSRHSVAFVNGNNFWTRLTDEHRFCTKVTECINRSMNQTPWERGDPGDVQPPTSLGLPHICYLNNTCIHTLALLNFFVENWHLFSKISKEKLEYNTKMEEGMYSDNCASTQTSVGGNMSYSFNYLKVNVFCCYFRIKNVGPWVYNKDNEILPRITGLSCSMWLVSKETIWHVILLFKQSYYTAVWIILSYLSWFMSMNP